MYIGPLFSKLTTVVSCAIIILSGCDTFQDTFEDKFFGDKEAKRLPGKRISILASRRSIEPDIIARKHQIILPAPTYNKDWPQTGGYANHAMHHMRIAKSLEKKWDTSIGEGSSDEELLMAQPIVAQNLIFTMDTETKVRAHSINDGREIWTAEITPRDDENTHINGGLAYENGRIYASTGFGYVVALAAKSGKVLWSRNLGSSIRTAPTVRDNRVFTITVTNKLFALNGQTGAIIWNHSGIEETTSLLGGGSPAVDSGVVIAPYSSGELVALKVENGQKLWSDMLTSNHRTLETTRISSIRGRPIIDRGLVLAVSNSGQFIAINLRMGRRVWERNIGSSESPWVAGNYLFLISNDNDLIALGRENGSIYWVTALPEWKDPEDRVGKITWAGPILASDRLILAGSNGEAISVSPYSGKILGKQKMPDGVTISPIIAQDTLLLLSDDAELTAYR